MKSSSSLTSKNRKEHDELRPEGNLEELNALEGGQADDQSLSPEYTHLTINEFYQKSLRGPLMACSGPSHLENGKE